jgi:hypothetical protein
LTEVIVDGRSYTVPDSFTYREMGLIKKIAGLRGAEIGEALEAGDTDLIVAITVISMRRAGQDVDENFILDLAADAIVVKSDDAEDDDVPPAPAADDADARPAA